MAMISKQHLVHLAYFFRLRLAEFVRSTRLTVDVIRWTARPVLAIDEISLASEESFHAELRYKVEQRRWRLLGTDASRKPHRVFIVGQETALGKAFRPPQLFRFPVTAFALASRHTVPLWKLAFGQH